MPGVIILPSAAPPGTLRFDWIDPGGTTHDLTHATSPALFVSRGASGLGDVDVDLALEKIPNFSGSFVRHASVPPREIELPITVIEDSLGDLVSVADTLRSWFATASEASRTPGYLKITRPDGSVRKIAAYRTGGISGDLSEGAPNALLYVISLLCPDPYPTADADTVLTYGQADLGVTKSLLNPGQLDAYPIWRVTGPGSAITISDVTHNKSFALTAGGGLTLASGQTVTIDTRPTSLRTDLPVLDGDGVSQFSKLAATSNLWHFPPGTTQFTIAITGASASTAIELRYLARYRGLLR